MSNEYITVSEFADRAQVTKQAIYKQVNNENSQLAPYVQKHGNRTFIDALALYEVYGVEQPKATEAVNQSKPDSTENNGDPDNQVNQEVEVETTETTENNLESQPISTDYIQFLKAQIAELKEEKRNVEDRLTATIQEKDSIIKSQTEQLSELAGQVAEIAHKALITTAQQQYLTAADKAKAEEEPNETTHTAPAVVMDPQPKKKRIWTKWFK